MRVLNNIYAQPFTHQCPSVHWSGTVVSAVEEEVGLDPRWESLATLVRDCARSIGTSTSSQSSKRTSTRNTRTLVTGHL